MLERKGNFGEKFIQWLFSVHVLFLFCSYDCLEEEEDKREKKSTSGTFPTDTLLLHFSKKNNYSILNHTFQCFLM